MEKSESERSIKTGFDTFNGLIGNAMKSLDKLKAKGMSEYGLSGTHTLCMRQMNKTPEGLTRTELARLCGVDRAQITRVIGDLLAKGLVLEAENGSNYRKKCLLTKAGKKIAEDINYRVDRVIHFVSGSISEERLAVFYETLQEICEKLEDAEDFL